MCDNESFPVQAQSAATIWTDTPYRVYFILDEVGRMVKIGFSNSPYLRLKEVQTGNPNPLKLLCVLPGGHEIERYIHDKFKAYRSRGEWFRIEGELLELIDEMKQKEPADGIEYPDD